MSQETYLDLSKQTIRGKWWLESTACCDAILSVIEIADYRLPSQWYLLVSRVCSNI